MAYGIELNNVNGDPITRFERVLYNAGEGVAVRSETIIFDAAAAAQASGLTYTRVVDLVSGSPMVAFPTVNESATPWTFSSLTIPGWIVPPVDAFSRFDEVFILHPDLSVMTSEDTVFYKLGSQGICSHIECVFDMPELSGLFSVATTSDNLAPTYRIASPVPAETPTGGYGIQLFNNAGVKTFDSRASLFSIVQGFVLTSAAVLDILQNNTTRVLSLSKSMPDCWISSPFLVAYSIVQVGSGLRTFYSLKIEQTANNELTVSRATRLANYSGTEKPRDYSHDVVLFVGRDN